MPFPLPNNHLRHVLLHSSVRPVGAYYVHHTYRGAFPLQGINHLTGTDADWPSIQSVMIVQNGLGKPNGAVLS
jgi:hypothetical protein